MDEELKEISNNFETTLSSEVLSFPSGKKVENISTVTEISDSEFDSKKASSEVEVSLTQVTNTSNVMSDKLSNPMVSSSKEETTLDLLSDLSPQVRKALQANANMLKDKAIVNDLLQSETTNYANTKLLNMKKKFNSLMSQYIHSGEQNKRECVKDNYQLGVDNPCQNMDVLSVSKSAPSVPYLSFSSTPKKSEVGISCTQPMKKISSLLEPNYREQKHVNFVPQDTKKGSSEILTKKIENGVSNNNSSSNPMISLYHQRNFTSFGPEIVFEKLGEIRTHLEVKGVEEGEEHATDLPLGRLLLAKLSSQKQRTKDLEEELTLNEASLTKVTCELEVAQKRLLRREEQLREASGQITQLQAEWRAVQLRLVTSVDTHRMQNEHLKKEIEAIRRKKASLEEEVKVLRSDSKELSDLKVKAESMKWQADLSSQRCQEVLQENQRLNKIFKEKEARLAQLEKEQLPQLVQERDHLRQETESLHTKLDTLTLARNALEEDLKQLKERHSVLLQKAIDEAELKEEAVRQKNTLSLAVERLKGEGKTLQEDLRRYYQCQLEAILQKKTNELKVEFEARLTKAQVQFEAERRSLRESSEAEKEEIQKRNSVVMEDAKRSFEKELSRRAAEWREIRRENALLRSQREAVVAAISGMGPGPLPPPSSASLDSRGTPRQQQVRLDIPDRPWAPSGPPRAEKCPLSHIDGLKPYQVTSKAPSESSEGNDCITSARKTVHPHSKGHTPGVPPLITSTSLSSGSASGSSEGVATVRERNPVGRSKRRIRSSPANGKSSSIKVRAGAGVRRFNGRKVVTAAQIIGSCVSSASSKRSSSDAAILDEVDREMTDLVRAISSMSSIVAPLGHIDETPRHDTSVELDSARLALRKIDKVSDMLASAWQEMNKRAENSE